MSNNIPLPELQMKVAKAKGWTFTESTYAVGVTNPSGEFVRSYRRENPDFHAWLDKTFHWTLLLDEMVAEGESISISPHVDHLFVFLGIDNVQQHCAVGRSSAEKIPYAVTECYKVWINSSRDCTDCWGYGWIPKEQEGTAEPLQTPCERCGATGSIIGSLEARQGVAL